MGASMENDWLLWVVLLLVVGFDYFFEFLFLEYIVWECIWNILDMEVEYLMGYNVYI